MKRCFVVTQEIDSPLRVVSQLISQLQKAVWVELDDDRRVFEVGKSLGRAFAALRVPSPLAVIENYAQHNALDRIVVLPRLDVNTGNDHDDNDQN
jgi:hypothetical protein